MSDILTRILATKQQEVAAAQAALSLAELRARAADMPPPASCRLCAPNPAKAAPR